MTAVVPPDLELWLTGYARARLAAAGRGEVEVGNKEPPLLSLGSPPLVVIRDDSGVKTSVVTFDRQVGVSVLAGSRLDDQPANDLARLMFGVLTDPGIASAVGSPITHVNLGDCFGPYAVPEPLDVARRYFTIGYGVVGAW